MICPTTSTPTTSKMAMKTTTTPGNAATKQTRPTASNTTHRVATKSSPESIWTSNNWTSDAWTGVAEPEIVASATWVDYAAGYCVAALKRVVALLEGVPQERSLSLATNDIGCQTDFDKFTVLAMSHEWQSDRAIHEDDDDSSCTTETSSTDMENVNDLESGGDEIRAIDADRLRLAQYLCTCDECALDKTIMECVKATTTLSSLSEQVSVSRVLKAFSSYNEVVGFDASMIPAALNCVQSSCGDEDAAFASFVTLYNAN